MTVNTQELNSYKYYSMFTLFLLLGAGLRLWGWSSQLFLDDEWHAFGFVMNRSFGEVVFQHGMGANSIPVNIWFWLTLHTIGWSEVILRLPSMLAGILSIILLPLLVKKLWGTTVSLIFAALLTVSPIVTFYTRVDRPFSPAMLFGTASFLLTLLWIRDGRKRDILLSAVLGFLGVYYHLYTAIPVVFPLIVATLAAFKPLSRHFGMSINTEKPWPVLWTASGIMLALLGIFVVLPNILNPWWMGVQGMSHANLGTLKTFTEFIAGSARYNLSVVASILVVLGALLLIIRDRTQGIAFVTPLVVFFEVIANYTQDGAHAGIQAARYGIVIFPISFIAIAIAIEWCASTIKDTIFKSGVDWFIPIFLIIFWLPFLITSPLWNIYRAPNNFTNHSGYQYNYTPISWENSPERELSPGISIAYNEIPSLYRSPETLSRYKGIIEYPMVVGDHFNLLFYYQHFHRLPVVAGYTLTDQTITNPPRGEWTYANNTIDYVMTRIPTHLAQRAGSWNSMVNIENIKYIKENFSGWLIIIHKNPIREVMEHIPEHGLVRASQDIPAAIMACYILNKNFGIPLQNNNHIAAWIVP